MKKKLLFVLLAICMVMSFAITVAAEETTGGSELITGSGTEADPFVISSAEGLVAFRDSVNAGETTYNAEGVYVALGANIDLTGIDWSVNIGDDCNATFDGIFDGKGYTISNLTAVETAQKADVYVCGGLFGAIYGNAVIKNLVIENVSINVGEFTGNNVGAVVGFVYNGKGSIENVTVCGKIEINAGGIYGVGAIVGYSYYNNGFTIENCKVLAEDGSYINASSGVGAIVGYSSGDVIVGCEVSNIALEAKGLIGGIAGLAISTSSINGAKVNNVTITYTNPNWINGTGIAVGTISSKGLVVTGVEYSNVTGADTMVGSVYAEKPTEVVPAVEVMVNGGYYGTLADAIANVKASDVITLVMNVEVPTFITVAKDTYVTIDLNGYTISGVDTTTSNFGLIQNNGTLVINDSVGTGKIEVYATVNSGWNRYSAAISNNPGASLTVNGGTIEHLGGTDMAYGIDSLTNGNTTSVEVVINGGTVKSTYRGIRQFLNGYGANNTLIINGGTVEGANKSLFFHAPSKNTPSTGTLVVGENAVLNGDVYLFVTAGSTIWDVEVSIAVAALTEGSEIMTGNVPSQYVVEETNGTVVVRELGNEAKITGAAVKLGADLSIKYIVEVLDAALLDNGSLYMEFVVGGETVVVTEYTVENGKYAFVLKGIAPQQMADVITATVKVGETVYAVKDNYSIKQNCANLLAKTAAELGISEAKYEAMKTLIADLLAYGDASQNYQDYTDNGYATDGIEGLVPSEDVPTEDDKLVLVNGDATLGFKSATVRFGDVNTIYVKIVVNVENESLVTVKVNGVAYTLADLVAIGDGVYKITAEGVVATDFDKALAIELAYDGNVVATLEYSINSYAYAMSNGATKNEEMKALALALYRYGKSAEAYAAIAE